MSGNHRLTPSHWAQQKEAYLGSIARRSKSPVEFIQEILRFVAEECGAKKAVLYLFDEDAPSLASIRDSRLELQTQVELVATACWGFDDPTEVLDRLFISSISAKAEAELKYTLPDLGFTTIETIPFSSHESPLGGIIAIYTGRTLAEVKSAKKRLRPVLSEASIMVDFVIDRFLQKDLVHLNHYGLDTVNFDTRDGMCRMLEETRRLIGCEGVSFFVRDTTTDDGAYWLTASSPTSVPAEPVQYSPGDNNFTSRALTHKKPSIIHDLQEVRRRISGLQPPKWCELPKGRIDRSALFVPVVRGGLVVALLRCSNKSQDSSEKLFNRLDVRKADAFAELLHTWQSAVENEVKFTSSLLDIAHELRTSAAGIKARAEYAEIAVGLRNADTQLIQKKLKDIVLSVDSVLEMMSLLASVQGGADSPTFRTNVTPFKPYADLCVAVVNSYRPQAEKRRLRFQFRGEHQMGLIYGDIKDFLHILQNVIGNAVKYTGFGKDIYVVLEPPLPQSRFAAIRVISESLPIRADEREQIFRFRYRTESAKASGQEGQGRGLAIARAKARRLKGDLVHNPIQNMNVFSLLIPRNLLRPPSPL